MAEAAFTIVLESKKTIGFEGPCDITKLAVDAIVNAANSTLMGGGGVDGAIHRAGGPSILAECERIVKKMGRLPAGKAVMTTAGRMAAKYVIHTVGPVWSGGKRGEAQTLASAYRESVRIADENSVTTIALPSISTGAYRYPVNEAAKIAIKSVADALQKSSFVKEVRFALFDSSTLDVYVAAARQWEMEYLK
ncbi:MAG TPA: O-acetyl-ADP-ribose deacetylase [Candidatus Koribacter sp.]|jgi:O-acetyl-ADP-ribose deacetylase (regulator of RNase III)